MEKQIAEEIMNTIHRLQLPFKLDQLTEGLGNCFPIAIIQQLRRPEILSQLRPATRRIMKWKTGHSLLRQSIHQFIMKSKCLRVKELKSQYEETDGLVNRESWDEYWTRMTTDKVWVDYWFVQGTAWYLQLDILIVATSNTEESPYIEVNGNLADGNKPSQGPMITLGTKSNSHYQSLLPIEMFHLEFRQNQPDSKQSTYDVQIQFNEMKKSKKVGEEQNNYPVKTDGIENQKIDDSCAFPCKIEDNNSNETFKYELDDTLLLFQCKMPNFIMKCSRCNIETRYIIRHLSQSMSCRLGIDMDELKKKLTKYKKSVQDSDIVKQNQRERKAKSRAKLRAENKDEETQRTG